VYAIVTNDNTQTANVTAYSPYGGFSRQSTVPPLGSTKIIIPTGLQVKADPDSFTNTRQGIYMTSTLPVRAYVGNEISSGASLDGFSLLPVTSLGTGHMAVTFTKVTNPNQFVIVGTQDNTTVYLNGVVFTSTVTKNINRFDTLSYSSAGYDLTGVHAVADKPVAFISGGECNDGIAGACDYGASMLLPQKCWGTEFTMSTMYHAVNENVFHVVTNQDNTNLKINNNGVVTTATINAYQTHTITMTEGATGHVTSSQAVQMVQVGENVGSLEGYSARGDPSIAKVLPLNQFSTGSTLFSTIGYYKYSVSFIHFINIITAEHNTGSIKLDGVEFPNKNSIVSVPWKTIPGTNFKVATQQIVNGTHTVSCAPTGCSYYGLVYGYTGYGEYSFVIGSGEESTASFCNGHGTAYCDCLPGYSGPTCNKILPNITEWLTPRCALYATPATKRDGIQVGCTAPPNSHIVCQPDNSDCLFGGCENPLGWCVPVFNDTTKTEAQKKKQMSIFALYQKKVLEMSKNPFGATNQACSGHGTRKCTCDPAYTGTTCEKKLDPCKLAVGRLPANESCFALCGPHGTFVGNLTNGVCICDQGFTGEFCTQPIPSQVTVSHRCALYTNKCTGSTRIGCLNTDYVCWPDDVRCKLEICDCPWGWCLPKPVISG
jgi:hypothetical protein